VQERGEPLSPITPGGLTYPVERTERADPALCPGRVLLARIPLGSRPSLHRLRRSAGSVVRRLRWYYAAIRLPTTVHHRRVPVGFPIRSAGPVPTDGGGISRFPHKVHPYMPGVFDRARASCTLPYRRSRCGLPSSSTTSAPRSTCFRRAWISRLNTQPARPPVNASRAQLPAPTHDSGSLRVANPSAHETFIHNTLPVSTGARRSRDDHR